MLKECPFCGSEKHASLGNPSVKIFPLYPDKRDRYAVVCPECGACGPSELSHQDAVAARNKRIDGEE